MPSPFKRTFWNKFEVALLMDAYQKVSKGKVVRKDAVSALSKRLRNRMIMNGIEISDKYRNENGIQLQMSALEYIITEGEKGISSPNKLFEDIVDMYANCHDEYEKILDEAFEMYPEPVEHTIYGNFPSNEEVTNLHEAQMIAPKRLSIFKKILSDKFSKGLRIKSPIDLNRFKELYIKVTGGPCDMSNEELSSVLKECGVESDGKLYVVDRMMPTELKDELKDYIDTCLSSGKGYVFYECLFHHFNDQLLDTQIANNNLLCTYLKFLYEDKVYFGPNYMALYNNVVVDVDKEVIAFMHNQWQLMDEDKVVETLSYLPENAVRKAFNHNQNVLISAGAGKRFHIDMFDISTEELSRISTAIDTYINEYQFMGSDELIKYVQQSVPEVINNNHDIPELGIRKALAVLLIDKFDFNKAVISRKGESLSAGEAMLAFAKCHEQYMLEEVKHLAQSLSTTVNYHLESLLKYSIRINETDFVAKHKVKWDVDAIDKILLEYIVRTKCFCPIRDITCFSAFPECNYPWTHRLLESYLLTESKMFKLYFNGSLGQSKVCGIVSFKKGLDISFMEMIAVILSRNDVWTNKTEALDVLVSEGCIANRKYAEIETAISEALKLRQNNNKKI